MTDPIVTRVLDSDGVERWASTDAPWVTKGLESGNVTRPGDESTPQPEPDAEPEAEVGDEATVPTDSDDPQPRPRRR